MAEYTSLGDFFGAVANAIREKKGTTNKIVPINFPEEIASIETGGGSSGGSSLDSWIAGETTELTYNGETIATGGFGYTNSTYLNKLTKFNGPNVKTIGSGAFYNRSELTEVNLPNLEETVGWGAFYCCNGLTNVSFPKVTKLHGGEFYEVRPLVNINIPNVEYLGPSAFYTCINLVMNELPPKIKYIGDDCFSSCKQVTFDNVPEGVTYIGSSAFQNCTGITKMVLPSTLTDLGGYVFYKCSNLTEVTFKSKPKMMYSTVFYNCTQTGLVINVPWASGEVSGAPWGATNATINYNYTG